MRVELFSHLADLTLTREKHKDVAGPLGDQFIARIDDRLGEVALLAANVCEFVRLTGLGLEDERPVAHLNGVGAARHLNDGGGVQVARAILLPEELSKARS